MHRRKVISVIFVNVLFTALAYSAPVDHVFVSNIKLDKLNLDGSFDKQFMPSVTDGECEQLAVNGNTGDVWLGCWWAPSGDGSVFHFDSAGNVIHSCSGSTPQFCHSSTPVMGGACIDPSGNVWFTDRNNNRVWKFQPNGTRLGPFSVGASLPTDITCDRLGNIWTANMSSQNISKLDNNGSLLNTYSATNSSDKITIDQFDNLWTVGGGVNSIVTKFSSSGSVLGSFPLQYANEGIAIDQNGNVWLSRGVNNMVTKLSQSGNNLGNFSVTGSLGNITIDASGNAWVVQPNNSTVTKLSNNGTNLGTFSLSGNSGQADTGFLHQRFVLGYDTVEGPNVWVPINGGAPAGGVTLTYSSITSKGNTTYTMWGSGTQPRYYQIITTATYSGSMEVCIGYNETEFSNENAIKLFKFNGTIWTDITTNLDVANNIVCGSTTSLGYFAITENGSGPERAIPTLSEWGMIILGALLMMALAWRLRRKYSTT